MEKNLSAVLYGKNDLRIVSKKQRHLSFSTKSFKQTLFSFRFACSYIDPSTLFVACFRSHATAKCEKCNVIYFNVISSLAALGLQNKLDNLF